MAVVGGLGACGALVAFTMVSTAPAGAAGAVRASCASPSVVGVTPDTSLTDLFSDYAQSDAGWVGGDGVYSAVLPGGDTAWLFSDSDISTAQYPGPTLVHNSVVLQDSPTSLSQTLFDVNDGKPIAYIDPTAYSAIHYYWPQSSLLADGQLSVFLSYRYRQHDGPFSSEWVSTDLATLSLPSLQVTGMQAIAGRTVAWGQWLAAGEGGYTYVYGVSTSAQAYAARVPSSDPLSNQSDWRYYDGSGWSADQSMVRPIASNVEGEYSVSQVGSSYALVTMNAADLLDGYLDLSFACSPMGPFNAVQRVYTAPQARELHDGLHVYAYNAHVQPQFTVTSAGHTTLVVSYAVDSEPGAPIPSIYRPQFVELNLSGG